MAVTTESVQWVQIQPIETGTTSTATQTKHSGAATSTSGAGPGHTGVPIPFNPSASTASSGGPTGVPGAGNGDGTSEGGTSGGGGLPPTAIVGIVVGMIIFLALLVLLLLRFSLRFRKSVQCMFAPIGAKLGRGPGGFHPHSHAERGDGMDSDLICKGVGTPPRTGSGTAGAAVAAAAYSRNNTSPSPQPPMQQRRSSHLRSLLPTALSRSYSRRVSAMSEDSIASSAFTPSPVSPMSPTSMLSPGFVHTLQVPALHPQQRPPDPRIIPAADARLSRGSYSSNETGSGVSAGLAPGQIAWPMPPGTPSTIQTPDGPQYVNFQRSGETVVRISLPPRARGSGG